MSTYFFNKIYVRDNLKVTRLQHAQNEFTSTNFYSIPIILQNNSTIIDFNGNVLARLFSDVVPKVYLDKLENTVKQHLNAVQ